MSNDILGEASDLLLVPYDPTDACLELLLSAVRTECSLADIALVCLRADPELSVLCSMMDVMYATVISDRDNNDDVWQKEQLKPRKRTIELPAILSDNGNYLAG